MGPTQEYYFLFLKSSGQLAILSGTWRFFVWAGGPGKSRGLFTAHLPPLGLHYLSLIFSRILSGRYWKAHFAHFTKRRRWNQKGWVTCLAPKAAGTMKERVDTRSTSNPMHSEHNLLGGLCVSSPSSALQAGFSLSQSFSLPHPGASGFPWSLGSKSWGDPGWNPSSPNPSHTTWYLYKISIFE